MADASDDPEPQTTAATDETTDQPDRPQFEGQIVFKGGFDDDDEPTPIQPDK